MCKYNKCTYNLQIYFSVNVILLPVEVVVQFARMAGNKLITAHSPPKMPAHY
jgi:hypothetical protein